MTAILTMLGGAIVGAGIAILIYIFGFFAEAFNWACQVLTCNCDGGKAIPGMWESGSFGNILVFCIVAGSIVGLVYGIYKMKKEAAEESAVRAAKREEEARKQRIQWAREIKQRCQDVSNICSNNKSMYSPIVSVTYKAQSQMEDILNELMKTAELVGKVDSLANELNKKDGDMS